MKSYLTTSMLTNSGSPLVVKFSTALCLLIVFSCNINKKNDQSSYSLPVEHINPTADQQQRRAASEVICKAHGVPVYSNPNALFVTIEEHVTIRTKDEVVDRALALMLVALKGETLIDGTPADLKVRGLTDDVLLNLDLNYEISKNLSPLESRFVHNKIDLTKQQAIEAAWRYESLHVMLWALNFVDSLTYPDNLCDVAADVKIISELPVEQFRQKAKLRSRKEILDQADLILRLDWACVEAQIKNETPPGHLNDDVVSERHYSLNWLIREGEADWDDVETGT